MRGKRQSFLIEVNQECIDNSIPNCLQWCIWSLAVICSIPGVTHVRTEKTETRFTLKGYRYTFPTPRRAARVAKDLDNGVPKTEIRPWRETLSDPISILPIRKPSALQRRQKRFPYARPRLTNRWNGRRI